MTRAVAVNVGANTNDPGFRGPVDPDGSFVFVPIPEREPTVDPPPTYADLGLDVEFPSGVGDLPVHLDPSFAEYPHCDAPTYGDPHGVKARPLLELDAGDAVYFYATLTPRGTGHPDWVPPDWGAFLVGRFVLARDPVPGDAVADLPAGEWEALAGNAHFRRDPFDAAVLLRGDPDRSGLFDVAVPLSGDRGAAANPLVTDLSADSGRGPWWRRPLRYDEAEAARLARVVDRWPDSPRHDPLSGSSD